MFYQISPRELGKKKKMVKIKNRRNFKGNSFIMFDEYKTVSDIYRKLPVSRNNKTNKIVLR